jgi:rubrerythrin
MPELAAEWHPTLNGDLTPYHLLPGSDAKVWWRCSKCQREWETKVYKRGKQGRGCRECSAARRAKLQATPKPGQSFGDLYPDVAAEWHPTLNGDLTPADVLPGSGAKVWWRCSKCHHEWETNVYSRGKLGRGCRECWLVRKAILRATPKPGQSFGDLYPDVAAEWHPTLNGDITPTDVKPESNKPRWWQCPTCGHEWEVAPTDRRRGEQCPECAERQRPITKSTPKPGRSLADLRPDIAAEWHPTKNTPLEAADVNAGSKKPRWWQCPTCGHEWSTTPDKRTRRGDGCPKCSLIGVSARQVRLEYELAAAGLPVAHDYPPIPVHRRSPVRADIVVPDLRVIVEYDGVRFHAELDRRDRAQTAALKSVGWTVLRVREQPLHGLGGHEIFVSPTEPIKSVTVKVLRALEKMGYVAERMSEYMRDTRLWAEAAANKAIHKYRAISLASESPALAQELHAEKNGGVRPDQVHPRSHTKFVWTCSICSHEWRTTVSLRAAGHGCPICAYRRIHLPRPGESFGDLFPEVAKEWHPTRNGELTPNQVRAGSGKTVWWQCAQGHEWEAKVAYRRQYGRCRECRAIERGRATG